MYLIFNSVFDDDDSFSGTRTLILDFGVKEDDGEKAVADMTIIAATRAKMNCFIVIIMETMSHQIE